MKRSDITDYDVCAAVAAYQSAPMASRFPYETLAERFGCAEKIAWRACERALDRGLLDYGVSLRTAWLTEEGLAVLRDKNGTRPNP